MKLLILLFLLPINSFGNYNISIEEIEDIQLTQTVRPNKNCKFLEDISVSIHSTENNKTNLVRLAKEKKGNFIFIKGTSSIYSYRYGG